MIILATALSAIPRSNAATIATWVRVGGLKDPATYGDQSLYLQSGASITITRVSSIYGYSKYDSICGANFVSGSWTVSTPSDAPDGQLIARLNNYDPNISGLQPDIPFELPNEGCYYVSGTPSQAAIDLGWGGRSGGYAFNANGVYTPSTPYLAASISMIFIRIEDTTGGGGGGGGGNPPPPPPTPTPTPRPPTPTPTPADIGVFMGISKSTSYLNTTTKLTVYAGNDGPSTAKGVTVKVTVPSAYQVVSNTKSRGSYSSGTWTIGDISSGSHAKLELTIKAVTVSDTAVQVSAKITSTTSDSLTANNTDQMPLLAAKAPPTGQTGTKTTACPRGPRARAHTAQVDASGRPQDRWFGAIPNPLFRPVLRISLRWDDLCFNNDGYINKPYIRPSTYSISATPLNGWSFRSPSAGEPAVPALNCPITTTGAMCIRYTQYLRAPQNSRFQVGAGFNLGADINRALPVQMRQLVDANLNIGFNASFDSTTTSFSPLPIAIVVGRYGITYATGAGDQPLPGSHGDY
ncbi:MAG: hypothetical protein OHK0022_33330 [Roseiflexaceae bacterium]